MQKLKILDKKIFQKKSFITDDDKIIINNFKNGGLNFNFRNKDDFYNFLKPKLYDLKKDFII